MVLALEKAPAVSVPTARLPSRLTMPRTVPSVDRKKRAVEAPATVGDGPMFRMELKIVSVPPVDTGLGVAVTAATMRSGAATLMAALAPTLLVSSNSNTLFNASATTRTKYVPAEVLAGMVTMVLALEKAPAVSVPTARLPSRTSVPSSDASLDRKKRAVDGPATVGEGPMFRMALKMLSVPPVETGLGLAVTAATMRSGTATLMAALAPTL